MALRSRAAAFTLAAMLAAVGATQVEVSVQSEAVGHTDANGAKSLFGQEWLASENRERVKYYKAHAAKLFLKTKKTAQSGEDPFMIGWECINTVMAVTELVPDEASSWMFAGKMALKLSDLEELGPERGAVDIAGFFARAAQLDARVIPKILAWLEKQRGSQGHAGQVMQMVQRWDTAASDEDEDERRAEDEEDDSENTDQVRSRSAVQLPQGSQAALIADAAKAGRAAYEQHVELGHIIAGDGVAEHGGAASGEHAIIAGRPHPHPFRMQSATGFVEDDTSPLVPGGPAASSISSSMRAFDMWPTRIATVNLARAGNLSADFNEKISRIALDRFVAFKDQILSQARAGGHPMPTPNDLDDKWFAFQIANPRAVRERHGIQRWPELYEEEEARAMYLRLDELIQEACEEYLRRFARPGTLKALRSSFSSDFWSAVYTPGIVHSHHTHQMSLVSAVYYSKAGARNTPIVFSDPRGATPIDNYEQFIGEHAFEPRAPFHQQLSYFPEEGELVLFPSWLVHKVPTHNGTTERVSWPYNLKAHTWDAWSRVAL